MRQKKRLQKEMNSESIIHKYMTAHYSDLNSEWVLLVLCAQSSSRSRIMRSRKYHPHVRKMSTL
jgi:hypothetical protein